MKRLFAITSVVVLCSALFFVVVGAADDFDGKWSGKSYVFFSTNCPSDHPFEFISIGKGVSSIMGGVNWFGMVCLDLLDTGLGEGTAIVSKPNGDALYLIISLTLNQDGSWDQTENIVGGAGRFINASGNSTSEGFAELNLDTLTGVWSGTNEGSITLP